MILDRLRQQRSYYNSERWKIDNQKREYLLQLRSEYPESYYSKRGTSRKKSNARFRSGELSQAMRFRKKINRFLPQNRYQNLPEMMAQDLNSSKREVITSGGEIVTQPPELETDDEIDELMKEVKSAERKERFIGEGIRAKK